MKISSIAFYTRARRSAKLRPFILPILFGSAILCRAQADGNKPQGIADHLSKAQEYLSEKRQDLAIPELQSAAALDPENVETQGNLGVLLYFQGREAEAIPHLRAAVEQRPSLSKIQGILGIAEVHEHDPVNGRKDLEASFAHLQDAKFKAKVGLELVSLYTKSGDLDLAGSVLAALKKVTPDNPEVLYAIYRTYTDLSFEAMLSLSLAAPDSAQMHQLLAHEEMKEGNTKGAIAHYRKAIAIDTYLPGVHFELAELLHTSTDQVAKAQAEQEYRAALAQNPQDEKAIIRLAEIAAAKGDNKQATDEYLRCVELEPGDAEAKLGLAKVLIETNETAKALSLLEESVRLEPTNAAAHYRLSTAYRKMGRLDDARREVTLYKQYKDMKEKLRDLYKELLIQPQEIHVEGQDEK